MEIQNLLNLISSLSKGSEMGANDLMGFLNNLNMNQPKSQNTQNAQNGSLNMSQILPLLSMFSGQNGNNLASLFPLISSLNLPNGFSGLNFLGGMQNFSPFLNSISKSAQKKPEKNSTIRSQNFEKNFDKFKRL